MSLIHNIPFGENIDMGSAMEQTAVSANQPAIEGRRFFNRLPSELQQLQATWMQTGWFYNPGGGVFKGEAVVIDPTTQWKSVRLLFRAIDIAERYLTLEDQEKMLRNLTQMERRHSDFLEEFVPLSRLQRPARVTYEPVENELNRPDFLIECQGVQPLAIEVKNRTSDQADFFKQLEANGYQEELTVPPNPKNLFNYIEKKFPNCPFEVRAQGAWITMGVAHDENELRKFFDSLEANILHFAILSTGENQAFILARSSDIERFVMNYFNLIPNPQAVRNSRNL